MYENDKKKVDKQRGEIEKSKSEKKNLVKNQTQK